VRGGCGLARCWVLRDPAVPRVGDGGVARGDLLRLFGVGVGGCAGVRGPGEPVRPFGVGLGVGDRTVRS